MHVSYRGTDARSLYIYLHTYIHTYIFIYMHSFTQPLHIFSHQGNEFVCQLCLLLIESSRELNYGNWSWETSAAWLCWIAGNPGVQHNSNIQFLFHIRKYFLIITVGVLEWFVRLISVSQIKRRDPVARFCFLDELLGKERTGSAWGRVAFFTQHRWSQPHQNHFKINHVIPVQFLNLGYAASAAGTKHWVAAGEKQTDGLMESGTASFRNSAG